MLCLLCLISIARLHVLLLFTTLPISKQQAVQNLSVSIQRIHSLRRYVKQCSTDINYSSITRYCKLTSTQHNQCMYKQFVQKAGQQPRRTPCDVGQQSPSIPNTQYSRRRTSQSKRTEQESTQRKSGNNTKRIPGILVYNKMHVYNKILAQQKTTHYTLFLQHSYCLIMITLHCDSYSALIQVIATINIII